MTSDGIFVDRVTLSYDGGQVTPVKNISLAIPEGTVLAMIGPSGSGKSTLLRGIAGIEKPAKGDIFLNGEKISPKKQKIGFVPQNYGLLPWKSVEENILIGVRIKDSLNGDVLSKMNELMENLGILEFRHRFPKEISGGQQQRVSLARAFLLNADALLMDEPFSALDAITREETQDVFLSLWKKQKITTLFVTHDVEEALYLGQRIVVLSNEGKILREIDNPFFGSREGKLQEEFFKMRSKIRELIQKAGSDK